MNSEFRFLNLALFSLFIYNAYLTKKRIGGSSVLRHLPHFRPSTMVTVTDSSAVFLTSWFPPNSICLVAVNKFLGDSLAVRECWMC